MRLEVSCSIYWENFVYDFVLLHLCYMYFHTLHYHVTVSHHKHMNISIFNFGCIHFEIMMMITMFF